MTDSMYLCCEDCNNDIPVLFLFFGLFMVWIALGRMWTANSWSKRRQTTCGGSLRQCWSWRHSCLGSLSGFGTHACIPTLVPFRWHWSLGHGYILRPHSSLRSTYFAWLLY